MNVTAERRLKHLLKEAFVEVLEERRDLLRVAVRESIEDLALVRAIQEGERSRLVSRKQLFKRFEPKA